MARADPVPDRSFMATVDTAAKLAAMAVAWLRLQVVSKRWAMKSLPQ
jgi:hypothetical protein